MNLAISSVSTRPLSMMITFPQHALQLRDDEIAVPFVPGQPHLPHLCPDLFDAAAREGYSLVGAQEPDYRHDFGSDAVWRRLATIFTGVRVAFGVQLFFRGFSGLLVLEEGGLDGFLFFFLLIFVCVGFGRISRA